MTSELNSILELIELNKKLNNEFKAITHHLYQTVIRLDERVPLDRINQFSELLNKPLTIDDKRIVSILHKFQTEMEKLENLEIVKNFSELKFIGKRLDLIEEKLDILMKDGVVHNIGLDFQVDGYQLVKKPLSYDKTENIFSPYHQEEAILESFTEQEKLIVKKYLGICGKKKTNFKEIGREFELSASRISSIYKKVIRILALSEDENILKRINSLDRQNLLARVVISSWEWKNRGSKFTHKRGRS